ncbi:MAG TPA: transcription elongation factor GreA [Longimicrobiales bacterium]|nr:transcription elongation factor GreA [Longimicrobiales bacterium]
MLDEIIRKLEDEVERLTHELNVTLPATIKAAVELGDLRENADYKSALERQEFVQARLNHLTSRLRELSNIDVSTIPVDQVGFGSWLKVQDKGSGDESEYTIVAGDFMDLDKGHISMASPLARGLIGAKEGEEVTVQLPAGERVLRILELKTLPSTIEE